MTARVKTMDVKKTQKAAETAYSGKKAQSFLADVKGEFKKITWTTREELRTYTKIVVCATFALGMGIYIVDVCIQSFLSSLGYVIRFIGG